jgi:hypothetical protein
MAKKVKTTSRDLAGEIPAGLSGIARRLDAILAVLLDTPTLVEGKKLQMMKRIEILNSAGLRNVEIARIVGLKPTTVAVVLNTLRKRAKQEKK